MRINLKHIVILLLLWQSPCLFAQKQQVVQGSTQYPFWLYQPDDFKETKKYPLLIVLHGKSLSGTDINRVKRYGVLRAIDRGRKVPAWVIAPQVASGAWNPDLVLEILEFAKKNYNIDDKRIYVCGMSLGGYGTLHFVGKYPDKVTAAVAICGGGNEKDAARLAQVPLWIIHGDNDKPVPISESKKVVNAIRKANPKAPLEFTVVKGGTHSSVENYFHLDAFYDWLFSQSK